VIYDNDNNIKSRTKTVEETFIAPRDSGTSCDILKILTGELAVWPILRHLVHLSDVYESVNKSLDLYSEEQQEKTKEAASRKRSRRHRDDEGGYSIKK
jgi:hypothetical protein